MNTWEIWCCSRSYFAFAEKKNTGNSWAEIAHLQDHIVPRKEIMTLFCTGNKAVVEGWRKFPKHNYYASRRLALTVASLERPTPLWLWHHQTARSSNNKTRLQIENSTERKLLSMRHTTSWRPFSPPSPIIIISSSISTALLIVGGNIYMREGNEARGRHPWWSHDISLNWRYCFPDLLQHIQSCQLTVIHKSSFVKSR